jgi:hypothetical protein
MNKRKGKILRKIWLEPAENTSFNESLKDIEGYADNFIDILDEANTRGDIE